MFNLKVHVFTELKPGFWVLGFSWWCNQRLWFSVDVTQHYWQSGSWL